MQRIMKEIADAIGTAGAFQVVRRWSGRQLAVPREVSETHPLALTLGLETARRLAREFGGTTIQLPDERHALRDQRNAAIYHQCVTLGNSTASVAHEWGLSRQAVAAIVAKMTAAAADSEAGALT